MPIPIISNTHYNNSFSLLFLFHTKILHGVNLKKYFAHPHLVYLTVKGRWKESMFLTSVFENLRLFFENADLILHSTTNLIFCSPNLTILCYKVCGSLKIQSVYLLRKRGKTWRIWGTCNRGRVSGTHRNHHLTHNAFLNSLLLLSKNWDDFFPY